MALTKRDLKGVTHDVIGSAIAVQRALGPNLLEGVYEPCLADELRARGRHVETQVVLPVEYKNRRIEKAYRLDMRVEGVVVVEIKAVEAVTPQHHAQLLSYLHLSGAPVGLIVNFGTVPVVKGVHRFVGPTFASLPE